MRMIMSVHVPVRMPMGALVFAVDVGMRMGVGMLVGVSAHMIVIDVHEKRSFWGWGSPVFP